MSTDTFENIERKLTVDLTGTSDTTTRSYTVSGAEDEDEALLAIDELAPSSIGVLLPKTIEVNEIGPRLFKIDVTYDFLNRNRKPPMLATKHFRLIPEGRRNCSCTLGSRNEPMTNQAS